MSMACASLADWLLYLEHRHSEVIQLGLHRVGVVAERMGLLHWDAHVITVAGTNGKGSTVAALEAIYTAAGFSVAAYTSPHLLFFNERIRVNQTSISDEALCAAFQAVEIARQDVLLTYFEMATLAALYYFKSFHLDVLVLEVGMGGRWDATNIIDADVSIITTIDWDHQDYLGDTLEAIGYEKAGILREGKPCCYADREPPSSVVEEARRLRSPCYVLDKDYFLTESETEFFVQSSLGASLSLPKPRIHLKAAAVAVMVARYVLTALSVTESQLAQAMKTVFIPGRVHVVPHPNNIITIYDVAHNDQSAQYLSIFLQKNRPPGKMRAVFSGLKDKSLRGLIRPLVPLVDVWYPAVLPGPRASCAERVRTALEAEGGTFARLFAQPVEAYEAALNEATPGDAIVVYGSFLMVSAIMILEERIT